ncbi:MAG: glycoside hydrolase family 38 C-terminal domain-containing protein [Gemmatimonadales bacterium]
MASSGLIFHLIAHTHWDREWYLPRGAFQARLVPVIDELVEQLLADSGYRSFLLDGQTIVLEDYLRARPEREPDVRALVKTGRLQIGPWYVLADEQIPSGEALVRNLLLGAADAERWGGRMDVLYSPDAFGHPAAWPTLAREFGIKAGVVWRGLGGEPGQERDLYRWRGPDGREILLWHLPPQGYEVGAGLAADRERLAEVWRRVRAVLVERAAGRHIPVFIGADHHAAPREVARLRDQLAALEPDNAFRVSRLDEFFQGAAADAGATPAPTLPTHPAPPGSLPVLAGELRWSYRYAWTLQGVLGTRGSVKRRSAGLELWLERIAEPLAALARRSGGRDRRAVLELAWRALVQCHFHDAIAGCASDDVVASLEARFTDVEAYAREVTRGGLHDLARHDPDAAREPAGQARQPRLVLWNPAARPRGGVVVADLTWFRRDVLVGPTGDRRPAESEGYRPFHLAASDGRALPLQVLDRRPGLERLDAARHSPDQDEVDVVRVAVQLPAVPGLGLAVLAATPAGPAAPVTGAASGVRGRTLANRLVEVTLEPTGALALHDRRSGERYFDLLRLVDGGDAGDAYTFCPSRRDRPVLGRGPLSVRRLAAGPLVAALEARYEMRVGNGLEENRRAKGVRGRRRGRGRVAIRLVVMLHADSPVVRCILEVDNRAANHRLRARVPTGLPERPAIAGTAFGVCERPAVAVHAADYPLETPVPTAPAQRFVAVADGPRGLVVLAPGFFEYELTRGGELRYTVLRAVGELSRGDLPTRPGHAGWPTAIPGAQGPGRHRVELALAPIGQAELDRGDVVPELWEDVFLPVRGAWLRDAVALEPAPVDIVLEGTGVVLSAIKPAQVGSSTILRCYNATGHKAAGAWRFGDPVRSAHRVRADERESVALVLENRGRTIRFVAEPHEIVTIMVT